VGMPAASAGFDLDQEALASELPDRDQGSLMAEIRRHAGNNGNKDSCIGVGAFVESCVASYNECAGSDSVYKYLFNNCLKCWHSVIVVVIPGTPQ
jgi:hypothetical protein